MTEFKSHIGELARMLIGKLKEKGVTEHIYLQSYLTAIQERPEDFCIITFPLTYRNKGAYQLGDVRFELVANDMENGRADLLRIEEMANKLLSLFPIHEGRFTVTDPVIRLKASDGLGNHSWTVQCLCMTNTSDKY